MVVCRRVHQSVVDRQVDMFYHVLKHIYFKMTSLGMMFVLLAISYYPLCAAQTIFEEAFQVKPEGHVTTVERKIGSTVCTFTYTAQGGTNEEWQFSLKKSDDKDKEFTCAVYRPGGMSYLFFQQFKLAVTGAKVTDVELYGEGGATLKPEEYVVDEETNAVTHAEGKFKAQLSRILITAKYKKIRKQKKEL